MDDGKILSLNTFKKTGKVPPKGSPQRSLQYLEADYNYKIAQLIEELETQTEHQIELYRRLEALERCVMGLLAALKNS